MSEEQYRILNDVVIPALMRSGEERRAAEMMGLAIQWPWVAPPERPSNVVDFRPREGHSVRV
jgi:hypothetical protein